MNFWVKNGKSASQISFQGFEPSRRKKIVLKTPPLCSKLTHSRYFNGFLLKHAFLGAIQSHKSPKTHSPQYFTATQRSKVPKSHVNF